MNLYRKYGFANTGDMLRDAYERHYAIPSCNYITMEQINAIGDAVIANNSPVIIMLAPKHYHQFEIQLVVRMAQAMVERVREAGCESPIALHLDHGMSFEDCKTAIDHGFSSVMIDGSRLPLEENIRLTRNVVDYAHLYNVTVEGEIGSLSGTEGFSSEDSEHKYTDPAEAEQFVRESHVDCIAISVGTVHGLNKSQEGSTGTSPKIRFDLVEKIQQRIPQIPLVLHGCSSLPGKYIDMINKYAGNLGPAVGIPDESLIQASRTAVCKINIASDGWLPSTAITRKVLAEHPDLIDSCLYRKEIRKELMPIYQHKMDIFQSTKKGGYKKTESTPASIV